MSARTTKPQTGDLFPSTGPAGLVAIEHGQPMTTSRRVADRFGKEHRNVMRAIEKQLSDPVLHDFNALNFERVEYRDAKGETRHEYHMTQAGFSAVALAFTGQEAGRLRVGFIVAFDRMAKELQRLKLQRLAPDWKTARAAVASQHSNVNAVLVEMRRAAGKTTEAHHLANEARLIGYAVTGVFAGLDRDTLDADQLRLLHKVECRDVILIAQGADYEARKTALRALVLQDQPAPDDPASAAPPPQIGGDA